LVFWTTIVGEIKMIISQNCRRQKSISRQIRIDEFFNEEITKYSVVHGYTTTLLFLSMIRARSEATLIEIRVVTE